MCRFRPARSTSRSSTSASDAPVRGDGRRIARPPRAEAGVTNIPYFQVFLRDRPCAVLFFATFAVKRGKNAPRRCAAAALPPRTMTGTPLQRLFAGLMLAILCAAGAGQQIHISTRRIRSTSPPSARQTVRGRRTTAPSRRGMTSTTSASAPTWALRSPNRSSVPWCSACSRRSSRAAGAALCSGCSRCGPLRVSDPAESSFGRSFPSLFIFRFMPRGRFRAVHPFQRHISTL